MEYYKCNTLRLTSAPTLIASRKAWNALFDAFGLGGFHPLEGRGALIANLHYSRTTAEAVLKKLTEEGFVVGTFRRS